MILFLSEVNSGLSNFVENIEGITTLITSLGALITAGIGIFYAFRNYFKLLKNKKATEIWEIIMDTADSAMEAAEKSNKNGADKKQIVIDAAIAACKKANIDIQPFLEQLDKYIDQTISFVNEMKK